MPLLSEDELKRFCRGGSTGDWSDRATALLNQQRRNWAQLRESYAALTQVRMRPLRLCAAGVYVQHNPGRFASAIARPDPPPGVTRPCALCEPNRPTEQLGLAYHDFILLANPAPIFSEHLTVVHKEHRPQSLSQCVGSLLRLARDLSSGYTVLYNGPGAGASCPEHLHLQACRRGSLPIERTEATNWRLLPAANGASTTVERSIELGRPAIRLSGTDDEALSAATRTLLKCVSAEAEPMVNAVCRYEPSARGWSMVVFPRSRHRPSCFFAETDARMLISPGVIDMAGVVIVPRLEDYERLDDQALAAVFREVSIDAEDFDRLCDRLTEAGQR